MVDKKAFDNISVEIEENLQRVGGKELFAKLPMGEAMAQINQRQILKVCLVEEKIKNIFLQEEIKKLKESLNEVENLKNPES